MDCTRVMHRIAGAAGRSGCVALAGMVLAAGASNACFNPADRWAAGVVWNNGEEVDLSAIERTGTRGVDYLKKDDGDTVMYIFRSHYAPDSAMVYTGYFAVSYQTDIRVPRMAVVLDSNRDQESFDFAAAVRVELDWMSSPAPGMVSMTPAAKRLAHDSLAAWGQGDGQYWTRQNAVLAYNSWYAYDAATGLWSLEAVRTYNGCGLDVAFGVPPAALSAGQSDTFTIELGNARFAVVNVRTDETHMVDAVRELNGQLYLPVMSHWPTFWNKLVTGYFEQDVIVPGTGSSGEVFVMTEIVGEASTARVRAAARMSGAGGPLTVIFDAAGRRAEPAAGNGRWRNIPHTVRFHATVRGAAAPQ